MNFIVALAGVGVTLFVGYHLINEHANAKADNPHNDSIAETLMYWAIGGIGVIALLLWTN